MSLNNVGGDCGFTFCPRCGIMLINVLPQSLSSLLSIKRKKSITRWPFSKSLPTQNFVASKHWLFKIRVVSVHFMCFVHTDDKQFAAFPIKKQWYIHWTRNYRVCWPNLQLFCLIANASHELGHMILKSTQVPILLSGYIERFSIQVFVLFGLHVCVSLYSWSWYLYCPVCSLNLFILSS